MMHKLAFLIGIFCCLPLTTVIAKTPLSLHQIEAYALGYAPEVRQIQAQKQAFAQKAIAVDQLPDPKLTLGAANVPVDTFNFTQENMTQIQVGLMQYFPKGHTLAIRSKQEQLKSQQAQFRLKLMNLTILKTVRTGWLDLYYWQHALKIYKKEQVVFLHLLDVTRSLLANNQTQQKDVVRAQLELDELKQQIIFAQQQAGEIKAQLARWVGYFRANQLIPYLPKWPKLPSLKQLIVAVQHHPVLQIDAKSSAVSEQGIALAKQGYKPGYNVGLVYGVRQGDNTGVGGERSDFVGAQVTLDLPIFPGNRQDRDVKASLDGYVASQEKEIADYRELKSQLNDNYVMWKKLIDQDKLYQAYLIPEAMHYAEATLTAYQNKQTDFPTLARAYVREYTTLLAALKTKVSLKQARVNLLYLQGK